MARTSFKTNRTLKKSELHNPVVIVVDMINGFAKEGALADAQIAKAAAPIENLLKAGIPSVFVCDTHNEDAMEFSSFPAHCLKGSQESEIMEELKPYVTKRIEKDAISAFSSKEFTDWLDELKEDHDFIVTGCCTDLCILQLALPLQSWLNARNKKDSRVVVPVDCVDTYQIDGVHDAVFWNDVSLQNMTSNGILTMDAIELD